MAGILNLRKETRLVSEVKKRRYGFFRWIVLALILIGIYFAFIGPSIYKPVRPAIALPPEAVWPGLEVLGVPLTNTMLATLIADVILIWMALRVRAYTKSGTLVPGGVSNFFEFIFEFLWNAVDSASGKWARRVIPLVATIFFLIFVANLIKMVPGFESIGYLEPPKKGQAYAPVPLFSLFGHTVYTIDKGQPVVLAKGAAAEVSEATPAEGTEGTEAANAESAHELCRGCQVVPFLRGSATDLNFTMALAVIAVVMTQVYGVMALGPGYFGKFFQFGKLVSGGVFGLIDFGVGMLELILEFFKILSFSFRLFGNVFGGAALLAIIGTLLPVVLPPGLYLFEMFFGIIQAYVFYLLATMFISMAMVSHHGDEAAEAHS
jgi:F-type H+-transporting ATPase subunit a